MQQRVIGIMGAMPEEIDGVVALLQHKNEVAHGNRIYYTGTINGIQAVVVFSRWGKVAAAATVAALIHEFNITDVVFTGVAGAVNARLCIGDIVIGKQLLQHDMDARPLMAQYEIPLTGKSFFEADYSLLKAAEDAAATIIKEGYLHTLIKETQLTRFGITQPCCYTGDIASGDQFFAGTEQKHRLLHQLPSVLCVEMEGAAVAQVCHEYAVPFVVIRTISDTADEQSPIDFPAFAKEVAGPYSAALIHALISTLQ